MSHQEAEILRRRPDGKTSAGHGREAQDTAKTSILTGVKGRKMSANSDPVRPQSITTRVGGGAVVNIPSNPPSFLILGGQDTARVTRSELRSWPTAALKSK